MSDASRRQLTDQFVELVEEFNQQMHRAPKDAWSGMTMTIPQIKTLAALRQAGSMRMGEIASHLGSTLSATSTIVDRLVNKGLVERGADPSDRRVVVCQLTAEGQDIVTGFWQIGRARIEPMLDRLDAVQLSAVVAALDLLCRTADGVSEADGSAEAAS